jgi:cytochrome P450 family 135
MRRSKANRQALPPGPSLPGLVQGLRWMNSPGPFLHRCLERYGSEFTLRLPGVGPKGFHDIVFLADPEAIERVFTGGPALSRVSYARRPLQAMFGASSLITADGPPHLRQRKLMLPPFHGERLRAYEEAIAEITVREIERWPLDEAFPLQERTQAITLEIILQVVFGLDDPERRAVMREQIRRLLEIVASPLVDFFMGLPGRIGPVNIRAQVEKRIAETDEVLLAEIRRRRSDPQLEASADVLALLLQAREEGPGLEDRELRDQLVTLLLAGHETTATALAWTFEHLFRDLERYERLRSEVWEQGVDSPYLDAVIKEVLRLRPPLAMCDRVLEEPFQLGSRVLPPGTIIAPCIYLVHRRADLYPRPDDFRPERFLGTDVESYAWIPFGGGMRRCIGASFALLEMKIVLEQILRRTTLRSATERPEPMRRRAIVLAPKNGTPTRLLERVPTLSTHSASALRGARGAGAGKP